LPPLATDVIIVYVDVHFKVSAVLNRFPSGTGWVISAWGQIKDPAIKPGLVVMELFRSGA
jgi:hypothetical protein